MKDQKSATHDFLASIADQNSISIPTVGSFPAKEIRYQFKKFCFLKKNGFFKSVPALNLNGKIHPAQVEDNFGKVKQIIFETTESCNLSCTYCTFSKFYTNRERNNREFSFASACTMLDFFLSQRRNHSNDELTVSFYGGEPLTNFSFIREVVDYLIPYQKKGFRFRFTMSSNGLLLLKYIDFLVQHQFDTAISLDGDAPANAFRIKHDNHPSFEQVIYNLDQIKEKYQEYFDKHISFLTVLHNRNSYGSIYQFFQEKYQKIPLISALSTMNLNRDCADEFKETFLEKTIQDYADDKTMDNLFTDHPKVKSLADLTEKYTGYYFKNARQLISTTRGKRTRKKYIPTATCLPFSLRVFLSADGLILPCEHIPRIFELGCFQQEKFNIDIQRISRQMNERYEKIRPLCEECYIHDHCRECIFNTGIETDHLECEFYTDEEKFSGFLSKNLSHIESNYSRYLRILKEGFHVGKT